jgi:hypothetical protein
LYSIVILGEPWPDQPTQAKNRHPEKTLKVHEQREIKNYGEWGFLLKTNVLSASFREHAWPGHVQGHQRKVNRHDSEWLQQVESPENSVNRLITGARYGVATAYLLSYTNALSVQQMVAAYYTLILVHKITKTGKPAYLTGRLKLRREDERELWGWGGQTVEIPNYSLVTSRAGFVYIGGRLYNYVSRTLREEMSISMFKKGAKKWVKKKIPIKLGSWRLKRGREAPLLRPTE